MQLPNPYLKLILTPRSRFLYGLQILNCKTKTKVGFLLTFGDVNKKNVDNNIRYYSFVDFAFGVELKLLGQVMSQQ